MDITDLILGQLHLGLAPSVFVELGHLAKENKEWSGSSKKKSESYAVLHFLRLLFGFLT
jgi:hypothetical protein